MIPYFVDSQGKTVPIQPPNDKGPQLDPVLELKVKTTLDYESNIHKMAMDQWKEAMKLYGTYITYNPGMAAGAAPNFDAIYKNIRAQSPPPNLGDLGEFSGIVRPPTQPPPPSGTTIMPDGGQAASESVQSRADRGTDPLYKLAVTAQEVAKSGNVLNTPPQLDQQFSQSLVQLRQANPNTIDDQAMTAFKTLREWEVRKGGELVNAMKSGNPGAERHLTAILTQIAAGRPFQQWSPEDQQEYVLFRSELDAYLRSQGRLTAKTE